MNSEQQNIIKQHISEICAYQRILTKLYNHPVTLDQAIADWLERNYSTVSNHVTS